MQKFFGCLVSFPTTTLKTLGEIKVNFSLVCSKIPKLSFSCGSTKCGYIVNFGLSPFFKSPLAEALNDASHYVCGFGESYNSVIKKRQMDIHVRY